MPHFRKKPVVIEALNFIDTPGYEVAGYPGGCEPEWYRGARTIDDDDPGFIAYRDGGLVIGTLEGEMRASVGDWIIRGVQGEVYPCKPDIFAATYEPVDV